MSLFKQLKIMQQKVRKEQLFRLEEFCCEIGNQLDDKGVQIKKIIKKKDSVIIHLKNRYSFELEIIDDYHYSILVRHFCPEGFSFDGTEHDSDKPKIMARDFIESFKSDIEFQKEGA